jgi:uncharacterized RmlC-like cupin family protein
VCSIIRPGQGETRDARVGGLTFDAGICAETVGATKLCMQIVTIPPGGRAKAHLHEWHETAVYLISGQAGMWWGERLEHHLEMHPGDLMYIPAGVPHVPYNRSATEPVIAVQSRTDPNVEEDITFRPELDGIHP